MGNVYAHFYNVSAGDARPVVMELVSICDSAQSANQGVLRR